VSTLYFVFGVAVMALAAWIVVGWVRSAVEAARRR